jgi:hypothetical protein
MLGSVAGNPLMGGRLAARKAGQARVERVALARHGGASAEPSHPFLATHYLQITDVVDTHTDTRAGVVHQDSGTSVRFVGTLAQWLACDDAVRAVTLMGHACTNGN